MGSVIIDITRPPQLPSRLFFYGLHTAPSGQVRSAAAIGLLHSDSFDIAHVYQLGAFGIWSGLARTIESRPCGATKISHP